MEYLKKKSFVYAMYSYYGSVYIRFNVAFDAMDDVESGNA